MKVWVNETAFLNALLFSNLCILPITLSSRLVSTQDFEIPVKAVLAVIVFSTLPSIAVTQKNDTDSPPYSLQSPKQGIVYSRSESRINMCLGKSDPCGTTTYCSYKNNVVSCLCEPGYYLDSLNSNSICVKVLQFGGELVLSANNSNTASVEKVESLLSTIYIFSTLLTIDVVKYLPLEHTWQYIVTFENEARVSSEILSQTFSDFIERTNCGDVCEISSLRIQTSESAKRSGNQAQIICDLHENFCNKISTVCSVYEEKLRCLCKDESKSERQLNERHCGCYSDIDCEVGRCNFIPNNSLGNCVCSFGGRWPNCISSLRYLYAMIGAIFLLGYITCAILFKIREYKQLRKFQRARQYFEMTANLDLSASLPKNLTRKGMLQNSQLQDEVSKTSQGKQISSNLASIKLPIIASPVVKEDKITPPLPQPPKSPINLIASPLPQPPKSPMPTVEEEESSEYEETDDEEDDEETLASENG